MMSHISLQLFNSQNQDQVSIVLSCEACSFGRNRKQYMQKKIKGHRRTQSSNLNSSTSDQFASVVYKDVPIDANQISALLAQSDDKFKEKVSSIDTINPHTSPEYSLFHFGRLAEQGGLQLKKKYLEEEYMAPIPEKQEQTDCSENQENRQRMQNAFSRKARGGIGVTQAESRANRQPFTSTLNLYSPRRFRRVRDEGLVQSVKQPRFLRRADRNRY